MGTKTKEDAEPSDEKAPPIFPFHAKTVDEVIVELKCHDSLLKTGLTSAEAQARLEQYGPNQLTEKEKITLCRKIYNQVANILVAILVFVAVVSLVRAITSTTSQNIVSNAIQVGLIVFVIT